MIFWALAILPGLLHPFLLLIYFLRFDERKQLIELLLQRSAQRSSPQREGSRQREEWQSRLDLNVPAYVCPVIIASLISIAAAVVLIAINDSSNQLHLSSPLLSFIKLATPAAVAGFAGAYVWGLYDFVDRFRILSLPPSALHAIWFRLLLGPVMGAYAQDLLKDTFAPVLVFALASIPVQSLMKWLQDVAAQRFAIGNQSQAISPPAWELVQGLTPDIIDRLNEAGVTSVAHLANQDPIDLMRRTNIEWRNILDMMDQAYLATYVRSAIEKLRARGIRGAIEMAILWQRLKVKEDPSGDALVSSIAIDLGTDNTSVRNLLCNLWEDPQVDRIWSLWFDREDFLTDNKEREAGRDDATGKPARSLAAPR